MFGKNKKEEILSDDYRLGYINGVKDGEKCLIRDLNELIIPTCKDLTELSNWINGKKEEW